MSISANRQTPSKGSPGLAFKIPVAASTHIYAGGMVACNSSGYLVPAGATSGHTVIGRSEEEVDNSSGADGDLSCLVREGCFKWANSSGSAVTQALAGKVVYVEDDQTVGLSEANSIIAGVMQEIDTVDGGIWVITRKGMNGTAVSAGYPSNGAIETVTTGAINPAKRTTLLDLHGTTAYTLADGAVEGQRKTIVCITAASTPAGTLTPTHFAHSTDTAMTFNAVDDMVELEWHSTGGWRYISGVSVGFAA